MRKILLLHTLFFCISSLVQGQAVWSKTWNAGNTELTNHIKSSHLVNDTLYYLTFNVCNFDGQDWDECSSIGKMDSDGNILKERLVENLSIIDKSRIPWTVNDQQLIFIDGKGSWETPTLDLKKYNRQTLEDISVDTYSIKDSIDFNFGSGIISFGDYYVASGWYRITDTDTWPDFLLWIDKQTMEIDTLMEYPYQKESVSPYFLFVDADSLLTVYWSGVETWTNENGIEVDSRGFLKIDKNKNIVSNYLDTIDISTHHQYPHAALQMDNGDMIYKQRYGQDGQVFPDTWNSNFDVLCIDDNGDIKWRFNKPGFSYTGGFGIKEILNMSETAKGDILACGYTRWHFNYPAIFDYNPLEDTLPALPDSLELYYAPYILKLDGETGDLLWQYSILEYDEYGNTLPYTMRQIHELSDGSIIGTGWSRIYDADGNYLKDNSWAIKLPADGCETDDNMECGFEYYLPTSTSDPILINVSEDKPFLVFPNPSDGEITIKDERDKRTKISYVIYDIEGREIKRATDIFLEKIDLRNESPNFFLMKIYDEQGRPIQTEKLVKL